MASNPEITEDRSSATILPFPSLRNSALSDSPGTAIIPIGDGVLAYRMIESGQCLCRAVGDEAIAASIQLFGPPTESNAKGQPVWRLPDALRPA